MSSRYEMLTDGKYCGHICKFGRRLSNEVLLHDFASFYAVTLSILGGLVKGG